MFNNGWILHANVIASNHAIDVKSQSLKQWTKTEKGNWVLPHSQIPFQIIMCCCWCLPWCLQFDVAALDPCMNIVSLILNTNDGSNFFESHLLFDQIGVHPSTQQQQ